jgi:Na+/H+ antiporter NhaA
MSRRKSRRKDFIRSYRVTLHTLEAFIILPLFAFIFALAYYAGGHISTEVLEECGLLMLSISGISIALHIDVEKELYKKLYK